MKTWSHDELMEDLAAHLVGPRRMIWANLQLGPAGSPRPDVYTIDKSFVRPNPTSYECKISREDFRADVTTGKWQSYLEYAHCVLFAAPAGLISKADVPEMCGLILRHENAWRLAKRGSVNPRPIAQEALLKLLIDGVEREGPKQRAKRWNDSGNFDKFARKFGSTAARYVADAASIHRDLERAEQQRGHILESAREEAAAIRKRALESAPVEWRRLTAVLGLEVDDNEWAVRHAIDRLRKEQQGGELGVALRQILNSLKRVVSNHEYLISEPASNEVEKSEVVRVNP